MGCTLHMDCLQPKLSNVMSAAFKTCPDVRRGCYVRKRLRTQHPLRTHRFTPADVIKNRPFASARFIPLPTSMASRWCTSGRGCGHLDIRQLCLQPCEQVTLSAKNLRKPQPTILILDFHVGKKFLV